MVFTVYMIRLAVLMRSDDLYILLNTVETTLKQCLPFGFRIVAGVIDPLFKSFILVLSAVTTWFLSQKIIICVPLF